MTRFNNPAVTEVLVPRTPTTSWRLHGFFEDIGWDVRDSAHSEFDTYVSIDAGAFPDPTVPYYQTDNLNRIRKFPFNAEPVPSKYAIGLRRPELQDMQEQVLFLPNNDRVQDAFDMGGKLLVAHSHVPPREHAGQLEFRFSDPFNVALRVTVDPGYEINLSPEPLVGRRIDHYEGTSYIIDEVIKRAEGYSRTGELTSDVVYTQIVAGGYPAGTRYTNSLEEILHGTTVIDGQEVPLYSFPDQRTDSNT